MAIYLEENVSINEYPKPDILYKADKNAEFTIGDLNGNALNLLYVIVRHGLFTFSESNYQEFVKLYLRSKDGLTKQDIELLNQLLAKGTFNKEAKLRLIGDEFADRGLHDFLTLKLLHLLVQNGVPVEILLSNHSAEFIEAYEKKNNFEPIRLWGMHAGSMQGLNQLIKDNVVDEQTIKKMIDECYKPSLKAITYSIDKDKNEISIYTHAGFDIEKDLPPLAKAMGVQLHDNSIKELAKTIDNINAAFTNNYVNKDKVHTLFDNEQMNRAYEGKSIDSQLFPFVYLMWNRVYQNLTRAYNYKGYHVKYVHGHDSDENTHDNIYVIDNLLGKTLSFHQAMYKLFYSHETSPRAEATIGVPQTVITQLPIVATPVVVPVVPAVPANPYVLPKPAYHPLLIGAACAAISALVCMTVGWSLGYSFLVGICISSALQTRKEFYQHFKKDVDARKATLTPSESQSFQEGMKARKSNTIYAKSFLDLNAWKNYRAYGAGLLSEQVTVQTPRIGPRVTIQ